MSISSNGDRLKTVSDSVRETDKQNGSFTHPEIRVFEEESALTDLSKEWSQLAGVVGSHIYLSPEWMKLWWKHFGKNRQRSLFLVTIWKDHRLIAIAPLYRGYSTLGPVSAESRLQIIGSGGSPNEQSGFLDDYGISDFLDFIVHREFEDVAAKLFAAFFRDTDVHSVIFHQAGDDSFIMRKLYPEILESGEQVTAVCTDTCPYIDLNGKKSLAAYIKQSKSNARRRFRQTLRAIGPGEEYVVEDINSGDELETATELMINLHQDRWNELGFPGVFYDKRFEDFFRELVRISFENNSLWFQQAIDADGVCASRMVLYYNGRYYDYISGFDSNRPSSKYRPGIGLLLKLVEQALDSGTERIELLRGEEGYKYDFTDENFRNWKVSISGGKKQTGLYRTAGSLVRLKALLYKYATRELRLLKVQRIQSGFLKMVPGYVKFRWKSLKLKLSSSD